MEGQDALSRGAQRNATLLFHTLLRSTLASKRVCSEYKLTRAAWHWLTGEVETRWVHLCRIQPALTLPPAVWIGQASACGQEAAEAIYQQELS